MAPDVSAESKVLFEVHEENLDTGLRGYPVGTCRTSSVDAHTGLHYVGYPISDLKDLPVDDVIFLLFNKRLPTTEESIAFIEAERSRTVMMSRGW